MQLQGKPAATLVLFVLSIVFVIQPVKIPIGKGPNKRVPLNLLTAPILAIAILWASQCLGATVIRDGIVGTDGIKPYNILILFFSLAYMSITLDVTGVLKAAAHWVSRASGANGLRLYVNFYLMVTALSAILGNDPVILSGTLFLLYYTGATDLDSKPWLMSEFAAANTASMILFVGNPTNVVICEGFGIQNAAFTAYTILPFVACSATCLVALILQYKTTKIKLKMVEDVDPWKYVTDPVGAIVGGILLVGCLITALVVSFLNVDVWKITLPFAGAKFLFDVFWDLYRTRSKERSVDEEVMTGNIINEDSVTFAEPLPLSDQPRTNSLPHSEESNQTLVNHVASPRKSSDKSHLDRISDMDQASPNHITLPPDKSHPSHLKRVPDMGQTSVKPPQEQESRDKSHPSLLDRIRRQCAKLIQWVKCRQPTLVAAFPRLPFALVPFAFSQFILIEALASQGWIAVFARWLVIASRDQMFPTIWIVGVMGIILCNIAGTNIGATILLTKVVRAAALSPENTRAAGIALALASNIGAVSFVFSASLAGLLWKQIIDDHDKKEDNHDKKNNHGREVTENKRINKITQREFARWNLIPLLVMTVVGLAVVSGEMAVLYRH
ncbi:hypothetical protein M378DRAFT_168894 [Amanita muscaria Koide BX008]|uniref:Citrate transporter-like domain-containing protein n=1 Tax=Amanita muscaria (strain Koide BX008) TaxID=946122 RepID=A0A0C2WSM6_AMAMK|nr:hypothetical protein M378DRAFT_168894 [Amanita muscaria Koide BX008]